MNNQKINTYVFFTVFILIGILSFFIIRPFLNAMITAGVLAYIFYPIYRKINKKINNKFLSSAIVSVLLVMIITIPILFAINSLTSEAYVIYIQANQKIASGKFFDCNGDGSILCKLQDMSTNVKIIYYTQEALKKARDYVVNASTEFIIQTPTTLLHLFVTLFAMYYLFIDGKRILRRFSSLIPFKKSHAKKISAQINDVTYAVVYGNVLVAFIQALIALLGYWLFGVSSPLIWAVITFFFAFIPLIGTAFVWIPLSLVTFIGGVTASSNNIIFNGIGLFLYGLLFISTIDNLVKPKVLSSTTDIHPVLVIVGVLGGISVFGFVGFVIGPLILALLNTFVKIYISEFA